MTTRYSAGFCLFTVLIVLLLTSRPAGAYFERFVASSRALALGGTFVAVADDPSATVFNPAGLTLMPSVSLLTTVGRPYGIADIEEQYAAVAVPSKYGSVGLSWHRVALRDVTSEDLFTIGVARDLIRTSQDASLSVGLALDISHVSYRSLSDGSQTKVAGSFGVLLRPFPIIGMGYTIRNIGQPTFDFVPGGGATTLNMAHSFGVAYHWLGKFSILWEIRQTQDGAWRNHGGVEVAAPHELRLRGGLTSTDVTGGLGITVSRLVVDAAVSAHEVLGLSYHVSLGLRFGRAAEEIP